ITARKLGVDDPDQFQAVGGKEEGNDALAKPLVAVAVDADRQKTGVDRLIDKVLAGRGPPVVGGGEPADVLFLDQAGREEDDEIEDDQPADRDEDPAGNSDAKGVPGGQEVCEEDWDHTRLQGI